MDKPKIKYSKKLIEDLETYHNINAEEELTRMLQEEVAKEILNEVMKMSDTTSFEEKIQFYDKKYQDNKDSILFQDWALNGLINSIYFRQKKIIRDHCE